MGPQRSGDTTRMRCPTSRSGMAEQAPHTRNRAAQRSQRGILIEQRTFNVELSVRTRRLSHDVFELRGAELELLQHEILVLPQQVWRVRRFLEFSQRFLLCDLPRKNQVG